MHSEMRTECQKASYERHECQLVLRRYLGFQTVHPFPLFRSQRTGFSIFEGETGLWPVLASDLALQIIKCASGNLSFVSICVGCCRSRGNGNRRRWIGWGGLRWSSGRWRWGSRTLRTGFFLLCTSDEESQIANGKKVDQRTSDARDRKHPIVDPVGPGANQPTLFSVR